MEKSRVCYRLPIRDDYPVFCCALVVEVLLKRPFFDAVKAMVPRFGKELLLWEPSPEPVVRF